MILPLRIPRDPDPLEAVEILPDGTVVARNAWMPLDADLWVGERLLIVHPCRDVAPAPPPLYTRHMLGVREAERDRRHHPRLRVVYHLDERVLQLPDFDPFLEVQPPDFVTGDRHRRALREGFLTSLGPQTSVLATGLAG